MRLSSGRLKTSTKRFAVGSLAIPAVVGLSVAPVTAAGVKPIPASAASGSAANRWLHALGPAAEQLPQIENALKKLPATASAPQVLRIVRPVGGLVQPINTLLSLQDPLPTSLEALGAPSTTCGGAADKVSRGVKLTMAGRTYSSGLQLIVNYANFDHDCTDSWRWHLGPQFQKFTAEVGLDESDTLAASLAFLGPTGKPLGFTADGQTVNELDLYVGEPTNITIDVSGIMNFAILSNSNAASTIDFVNDSLTP